VGGLTAVQLVTAKFGRPPTRLATWLRQFEARGAALPAAGKLPVVDRRRGWLFAAAGVAILAASVILQTPLPAAVANRLSQVNMFVYFLAFGLLVRSRRYFQVDADTLLAVDHRPPVLLLRSFEADEKAQFGAGDRQLLDFSLETRLANHFIRFGPFIAVGSPLDKVPQIGAARAHLADDQWQGVVLGWMASASVVLMLAGKTKWVTWELG